MNQEDNSNKGITHFDLLAGLSSLSVLCMPGYGLYLYARYKKTSRHTDIN